MEFQAFIPYPGNKSQGKKRVVLETPEFQHLLLINNSLPLSEQQIDPPNNQRASKIKQLMVWEPGPQKISLLLRDWKLTSIALWASLSIQMIAWSEVALQERTICSNRPSTGTAVLTTGGILPNLQTTWNVQLSKTQRSLPAKID